MVLGCCAVVLATCLLLSGFSSAEPPYPGLLVVPLVNWTATPAIAPLNLRPEFTPPFLYRVPGTIVGNLVDLGAFPFDPMEGENFPLLNDPSYNDTWTVETTLPTPVAAFTHAVLHLDGVNYRASLSVNGVFVTNVVGTFCRFEIPIGEYLLPTPNAANVLSLNITPPQDHTFPPDSNSTDLAITFVDWNPEPPDHMMGLWRPVEVVFLNASDSCLTANGPSITTVIDDNDNTKVSLNVSFVLHNWCSSESLNRTVYIHSNLFGLLEQHVVFAIGEREARVQFDPVTFRALQLVNPPLWWPWQMGNQALHTLRIGLVGGPELLSQDFGVRQVEKKLVAPFNQVQFFVNKKPIQIRGAGWTPDIFLRNNATRLAQQFSLVQHMGLNTLRLEGKMESLEFFQTADEMGLMVLPGWCCCDSWQHWSAWTDVQVAIARQSLRDQLRRLALHPSVVVFFISSDELPPEHIEAMYLSVAAAELWPNPTISSAGLWTSNITGTTGVKMSGPYSWVPPVYWLADEGSSEPYPYLGGAWGFLTEGGPGEAPMTYSSWVDIVGVEDAWSANGSLAPLWDAHCGNPQGHFGSLRFYTPALYERYGGNITSAAQYLFIAQAVNYEGIRAFMEGYSRNKHQGATGFIQWMLNNAWPSHIWHLYSYDLNMGGGFYGAKKALGASCATSLHLMFSYTNGDVWLINSRYTDIDADALNITLFAQVVDLRGAVLWSSSASNLGLIGGDASVRVSDLRVPLSDMSARLPPNSTYLVRLFHSDGSSMTARDVNDYWLGTTMDVLDWNKSNWFRTPCRSYANFQQLRALPSQTVGVETSYSPLQEVLNVTLSLPQNASSIAFFVRLDVVDMNGNVLRPIRFTENYITLVPGEVREVAAFGVPPHWSRVEAVSWNDVVGGAMW